MRRSLRLAAAAATAVVLLSASAAAAKEGGVAKLAIPLPREATPGSTITVHWSMQAFVNDQGVLGPFSAEGVYIKLIGSGDATEAVGREEKPGWYVAEVVVPTGGIRNAEFGVRGFATAPDGTQVRSDKVFGFQGMLLSAPPLPAAPAAKAPAAEPAAGRTTPSTTPSISPLAVLGVLALALAGVGTALTLRRRAATA